MHAITFHSINTILVFDFDTNHLRQAISSWMCGFLAVFFLNWWTSSNLYFAGLWQSFTNNFLISASHSSHRFLQVRTYLIKPWREKPRWRFTKLITTLYSQLLPSAGQAQALPEQRPSPFLLLTETALFDLENIRVDFVMKQDIKSRKSHTGQINRDTYKHNI